MSNRGAVRIEPWADGDLPLLERLLGDPRMTEHLGGPESPEKLRLRQARYERLVEPEAMMFKIIDESTSEAVGSVGYWERAWHDQQVYEMGWSVLPGCQRRGIARAAAGLVVARVVGDGRHRFVHAFPSVDNVPSNAICRALGFVLIEERDFEYPPGNHMRCNDWRLDLTMISSGPVEPSPT